MEANLVMITTIMLRINRISSFFARGELEASAKPGPRRPLPSTQSATHHSHARGQGQTTPESQNRSDAWSTAAGCCHRQEHQNSRTQEQSAATTTPHTPVASSTRQKGAPPCLDKNLSCLTKAVSSRLRSADCEPELPLPSELTERCCLSCRVSIYLRRRASRSHSSRQRMSPSRTGPFTLRMMERVGSSRNSTRTCQQKKHTKPERQRRGRRQVYRCE